MSHILPPLISNANIPAVQRGAWSGSIDSGLLEQLASSIQPSRDTLSYQTVTAIPDTWAQVEIFQEALRLSDPGAIGEWRGLLALFALRPQRKLPLEIRLIDLQACQDDPYGNGWAAPGNFAQIMADIPPHGGVLQDGMSWSHLASIRISGYMLGLVVPNVLVCPAANPGTNAATDPNQARLAVAQVIPWYDAKTGRLLDPCRYPQFCPAELAALHYFLGRLGDTLFGSRSGGNFNQVSSNSSSTNDVALLSILKANLTQYSTDCLNRYNALTGGDPPLQNLQFQHLGSALTFPPHQVYRTLSQGWEPNWDATSDVLIPRRPELEGTSFRGAILCDPAAAGTRNPSGVQVWAQHCLTTVLERQDLCTSLADIVARAGYIWLSPTQLFTQKLVELTDSEVASHGAALGRFLLPLTPIALLLWSPRELLNSVRIDADGEAWIVKLTVHIQDHRGASRQVELRRRYDPDTIQRQLMPTTLSQWPLTPASLWHSWHFLFYGGSDLQVTPAFPISAAAIASALQNALPEDGAKLVATLHTAQTQSSMPGGLGSTLSEQAIFSSGEVRRGLYRTQYLPEVIVCGNGLILLPTAPQSEVAHGDGWRVAIDFGTSNTMVYYCPLSGDQPRVLNFVANPVRTARANPGSDEETRAEHREFLPLEPIHPPFMTILRSRGGAVGTTGASPLWSDNIYYVDPVQRAMEDVFEPGRRPLRFGFKWSSAQGDRRLVLVFLAQVALQVLAEAAHQGIPPDAVQWYFSYPEAYRGEDLRQFQRLAHQAVKLALGATTHSPKLTFDQESLATARYFAHTLSQRQTLGVFAGSVITMDIGGGSSDITVWHDGKLLWRTSLRVAGQHILIDYLARHWQDFLKQLAQHSTSKLDKQVGVIENHFRQGASLSTIKAAVEVLVNGPEYRQAMTTDYAINAGSIGVPLARLARFVLGGMLYYVGLALRALHGDNFIEHQQHSPLTLCLGGRGCRLYQSLFGPDMQHLQEEIGPAAELLSDACGGAEFAVTVVFSEHPKSEVAYGLLVGNTLPSGLDLETSTRRYLLPLGETLQADGYSLEPETSIEHLDPRDSWQVTELPTLDAFIAACRRRLKLKVDISPKERQRLVTTANQALSAAHQALAQARAEAPEVDGFNPQDTQDVEPIFIVVLRALIEAIVVGAVGLTSLDAAHRPTPFINTSRSETQEPPPPSPWEKTMLSHYCGLLESTSPDIQQFRNKYKVRGVQRGATDDIGKASLEWTEQPFGTVTFWAIPVPHVLSGRYHIFPGIRVREQLSGFLADDARLAYETFQGIMDIIPHDKFETMQPVIAEKRNNMLVIIRTGQLGLPLQPPEPHKVDSEPSPSSNSL